MSALSFHAGPRALAHLRTHGLRAADVAIIPAAAGGPKGLIFQHLDQWLFGDWLAQAPRERTLIGSSIGAWRMAAACQRDPAKGIARLGELYSGQRYTSAKPTQDEIDTVVQELLREFISGHEADIVSHPQHRLHLITVRGAGPLASALQPRAQQLGFARAALHNLASRERLGRMLERVVIGDSRAAAPWLRERFDSFTTHFSELSARNLGAGLLASGTLPLIMKPVSDIADAPPGCYWDGGIIDYQLALPYSRASDIVLYPHFNEHIVPGWLDKPLPWRRTARGPNRGWLDNVLIVSPSQEFKAKLPRGKLPDRSDFKFYGIDQDRRIRLWRQAMAEGERLRDELAEFAARPDLSRIHPL